MDVRRKWCTNFSAMCVFAWLARWFARVDIKQLREYGISMGEAHLRLQVGKLLWSHLLIDHMYFFSRHRRILSKFAYFAMQGSHCRMKRMLQNSAGLRLLRDTLCLQVVVDNHTIDDNLRLLGWEPTKRSMRDQGPIEVRLLAA